MERRQLLKAIGLAGVGAAHISMPLTGLTNSIQRPSAHNIKLVNAKDNFNKALQHDARLIGFADMRQEHSSQPLILEGKLPTDIQGDFYRNGPAGHERSDMRYLHLFEGDGMVQGFHFENGQLSHQAKFVKTSKFIKEQKADKFLYSGPDSRIDNALPVSHPDMVNPANTNVIAVGEELWALWEAGSATALDPRTLDTKHTVNLGQNSHYGDKLKGLAFSAHPKIEASGDIWNFGLSPTGHIALFHLSSAGKVKNVGLIDARYKGGMLHDFLITDKHILLILPSLNVNPEQTGFFAQLSYSNDIPMQVLVIDKQSLTLKKHYELESGFAFHYGNAWEEADGTIHFDASLYKTNHILTSFQKLMQGQPDDIHVGAKTVFFSLKANGSVHQQAIEGDSEFPRIFASKVGLQNQYLFTLAANDNPIWNDTINCFDLLSGNKTSFNYGKDFLVEEHIPIATQGVNEQGYLLGTALHIPSKRTCLNIFKADRLNDGPICRAWLPYHMPLGFHGNFVAS